LRKIHRESNEESLDNTSSDFTGDDSLEIASSGDHGRSGLSGFDGSLSLESPLDLSLWLSLSVFLSPSLFLFQMGERRRQEEGRRRKSEGRGGWFSLFSMLRVWTRRKKWRTEQLRREKNKEKGRRRWTVNVRREYFF